MMILATLVFALSLSDSTETLYAQKDTAALHALLAQSTDRTTRLLCRYRLYPLTEDARYLDDLPETLDDASARELALLAGLWGYKAGHAPFFRAMRYGMRSQQLLDQAKTLDPDDPFVLLIDGQSLIYKPKIAGGSTETALERFRHLRDVVAATPDDSISTMEADLWIWYALHRMKAAGADEKRAALLDQDPPPLFREFLLDPP